MSGTGPAAGWSKSANRLALDAVLPNTVMSLACQELQCADCPCLIRCQQRLRKQMGGGA